MRAIERVDRRMVASRNGRCKIERPAIDRPATSVQAMAHQHKPLFIPAIGDQYRLERKFQTMRNQREIAHLRSVCPVDQEDATRRIG
ncbi:MAG: hypothetical protein VX218_15460, partial [Pseudomonadota bacterium]|nr:hypothetical protein [Pseudomonadota bacterium]